MAVNQLLKAAKISNDIPSLLARCIWTTVYSETGTVVSATFQFTELVVQENHS